MQSGEPGKFGTRNGGLLTPMGTSGRLEATEKIGRLSWGIKSTSGSVSVSLPSRRLGVTLICAFHPTTIPVPVGHSDEDGVTYPTNPRFDREGRWRPRKEWPVELR